MYERKTIPELNCGLDLVGEVLYGKWKMRLLWFIHEGICRPSELQRKIPQASRRVLNMQLHELQQHELVVKKTYPVLPPKVEYYLTDFGKTLIPVIEKVGNWGDANQERLKHVIISNLQSLPEAVANPKVKTSLSFPSVSKENQDADIANQPKP